MTTYNTAAKKAEKLVRNRAPRNEVTAAVHEAIALSSDGGGELLKRLDQALKGGKEVRSKAVIVEPEPAPEAEPETATEEEPA